MAGVFIRTAQEAYILSLIRRFKLRRLLTFLDSRIETSALHGLSSVTVDERSLTSNSRTLITMDTRPFLALLRILRLQGYQVEQKREARHLVISWVQEG